MITKEQVKEILTKNPAGITKEELKFVFGIFCLSIKEYEKSEHNLWFEVHFERIYIAQIRYGIKGGMSFSNEYVNMGDGCHGVTMGTVNNTANLLKIFINMFYDNLLKQANYAPLYNEETSQFESLEQAQEYLEYVQSIKNLTVKMTYRVGLGNVEVPDDVYDSLVKCYDEGGNVPIPNKSDEDSAEASEWLSDNIREADAMDWEYEIEDFEE